MLNGVREDVAVVADSLAARTGVLLASTAGNEVLFVGLVTTGGRGPLGGLGGTVPLFESGMTALVVAADVVLVRRSGRARFFSPCTRCGRSGLERVCASGFAPVAETGAASEADPV